MRWQILMTAAALAAAGCTETKYVDVPVMPVLPKTPVLDACAEHAATAQRSEFGDSFRGLRLDTKDLILTAPAVPVGTQPVGAVYDGRGVWYGQPWGTMGEWRRVRFHCLVNPKGQVVYSFVRSE